MNVDVKEIKPLLLKAYGWLKRYSLIICIIVISLMYGYLMYQINNLNNRQPSQQEVTEKLEQIGQPSISEETVDKLKALEENSTEVQSLFQQARENPFQE